MLLTCYPNRTFFTLKKRKRLSLIVSVALLSLVLAPHNSTLLPSIPPAHATARTITLFGFSTAWNATTNLNPTITVNQGDVITVALTSEDAMTHRFVVDVDRDGKIFTPICPPDECSSQFGGAFPASTTFSFTVNFAAGTYTYYCTYHPFNMFANFVVLAVPVGGTTLPVDKDSLLGPYIAFALTISAVAAVVLIYFRRTKQTNKTT
jgi:plastocyanin